MQRHNIVHYTDVCRIINLYYKDPKTLMDWVINNKTPFKKKRIKRARSAEEKTRKSARKPKKK